MFAHSNAETIDDADWIIVGIPNDKGSLSVVKNYIEGPDRIRDASYRVFAPIFSRKLKKIFDWGDVELEYEYNLYDIYKKIESELIKIATPERRFVFLGGDHSITYPILRIMKALHDDFYLLYFDAHPDMQPDPYINYQSYIKYLIDEKVLDPNKIIMVGINNWSEEERQLLEELNIKYYTPFEVWDDINRVSKEIEETLSGKKVYMSVDLDVFDMAAGHWIEPFGINPYHFFKIIRPLSGKIDLISFDITELYPEEKAENWAARLIVELTSLF